MNLSLSNTLGKRMAINPDGLSLDLAFAADKTLTARKGPTPTFTRAFTTATFVGSNGLIQSAAINEARFDHDPVTLACRGLLIEEQRTNALLRSTLNTALGLGATITLSHQSPIGSSAILATNTVSSSAHRIATPVLTVSATTYAVSVFVKANGTTRLTVTLGSTTEGEIGFTAASFNLVAKTVTDGTGTIEEFQDGYFRVTAVSTVTTAGSARLFVYLLNSAGVLSYSGNATDGLFIDGGQVEIGAFPTSYIPTTTAPLIRSADVCSISGANFTSFYNQSEGTVNFAASIVNPSTGNNMMVYAATDGTTANLIQSRPSTLSFVVVNSNSITTNLNHGTSIANVLGRQASAYKLNDFASSKNGLTVLTDNSGNVPVVNQMGIGNRNSSDFLSGHIARIQYFKKRLPNAKLITLTT